MQGSNAAAGVHATWVHTMSYRVVAEFIHSGCEVHGIAAIIMGHGYPLGGATNSEMDSLEQCVWVSDNFDRGLFAQPWCI